MKGTSKLIMGATLVMVVSLAVVLGLILVLLAELYCSLLLRRRRQLRNTTTTPNSSQTTTTTTTTLPTGSPSHAPQHPPPPPPPFNNNIYAQGVLQAPRSFLFPCMESEPKKHHHHQVIHIQPNESIARSPHGNIGVFSVSSSPSPSSPLSSFISRAPPPQPKLVQQDHTPNQGGGVGGDHLVYISNPIYENEEVCKVASGVNTPFETPDTSPSRLEKSDEDEEEASSPCGGGGGDDSAPYTPPLSPIKKLSAEACSVSLRDASRSLLGTSGSDHSHSVNGPSNSSSSGSPCTSPSW